MPTTKKRLNITLSKDMEEALSAIAKRDNVPEATKAASLLQYALETEEDEILDTIATDRFRTAKKWLSPDEVWK